MTVEIAQDEPDKRLASEVGLQVGRLLVETQGWSAGKAYVEGTKAAIYGAEMAIEVLRMSGSLGDAPTEEEVDRALDTIADELGVGHRVKGYVVSRTDSGESRGGGLPILGL